MAGAPPVPPAGAHPDVASALAAIAGRPGTADFRSDGLGFHVARAKTRLALRIARV